MSRRIETSIHPSLPIADFSRLRLSPQPCLISGLSYRVFKGASPGRGLAPAMAAGGINLLPLKCWKLCKCQTHPSDVPAEGGRGWRGGGKLRWRVVDEPSAEAGPLLPFVAGGCQVQMLLLAPCFSTASQFFFLVCWVCEHLWKAQTPRGLAPVRQLSEQHISQILTMSPLTSRR